MNYTWHRPSGWTVTLIAAATIALSTAVEAAEKPPAASAPLFESQVRPILKAHCFQCHGDDGQTEGGLDLRLVRLMRKGGDSGPAVTPGKSATSLIVERLIAGEMPPGEKKVPTAEVAQITRWVDAGAKTARPEPEAPTAQEITDQELAHWSFQPITRPDVPKVQHVSVVRTPVDAFVLARLEQDGLSFSPEADRRTLVRRAYFDLLGLPPTPEQVDEFLTDIQPGAWERLIDRLLASPHYGERWGRLWLDLAGYADSDGASQKDTVRPHAYLYRDYVLRSINDDKPFDDFLREQLAGDEMLTPPYRDLSPKDADRLIATGFLRMGPDGTGDSQVDVKAASNDVVAETIKIVSTSLLGMSVGCAQCHSHRYEPIPQADYYRLRAIFEPSYDWKNWRAPGKRLVPLESLATQDTRDRIATIDAEVTRLKQKQHDELTKLASQRFEKELAKIPANQHEALRGAYRTPLDDRGKAQQELLTKYPDLDITAENIVKLDLVGATSIKRPHALKIIELLKQRPELPHAQALTELPGKMPTTYLFFRGDFNQPREPVHPGELSVLTNGKPQAIADDDPNLPTTGRRTAYARQLTNGKHPLVARVLVNRVWLNHFGRGIVSTPTDFGVAGQRPSHPELLDWLASQWMADGWRLKSLHRLLMTSAVYQQVSHRNPELERVDPENRLLGRMSVRRLEAEMVRDAILATTGSLNLKMSGPPVPVSPDELGQIVIAVDTRDSVGRFTNKKVDLGDEVYRRSLYVQVRRSMPLEMLETFDGPRMSPNCELRTNSTVAPQSLLLMNNAFLGEQAVAFARSLRKAAPNDVDAQINLAWLRAYAEMPTAKQREHAKKFLTTQAKALTDNIDAGKELGSGKKVADKKGAGNQETSRGTSSPADVALETFCQALLCSNRFLYID